MTTFKKKKLQKMHHFIWKVKIYRIPQEGYTKKVEKKINFFLRRRTKLSYGNIKEEKNAQNTKFHFKMAMRIR